MPSLGLLTAVRAANSHHLPGKEHRVRRSRSLIAGSALLCAGAATAADLPTRRPAPVPSAAVSQTRVTSYAFVSELRLGGFAHDPFSPESGSGDVNIEILSGRFFESQDPILKFILPSHAHLGTTLNTGGDTSHVYAGLTWQLDVTPALFFESTFGGAIHDGDTGRAPVAGRNALGCSPLFRESASLGYRVTSNWTVMGTVEHLSNAGLCRQNRGLTNFGARLGYSF